MANCANYYPSMKIFRFLQTIEDMLAKDIADNKAIGDYGAKEILSRVSGDSLVRILTHCNTGSLATANYGTALGVIRTLHEMKRLGNISKSSSNNLVMIQKYIENVLQNMFIVPKRDPTIKGHV